MLVINLILPFGKTLFEREFIRVLNLISDKRDMSTKRLRFMPQTLRSIQSLAFLLAFSLSHIHTHNLKRKYHIVQCHVNAAQVYKTLVKPSPWPH